MKNKEKKGLLRKSLFTGVLSILLLGLYYLIFHFSAQDSAESGSLSRMVTERCVDFINRVSGAHWSDIKMAELAEYFEHPIRKLAHFSEYAYMGVLVYTLWSQWIKKGRVLSLLTVGWVFVSAAADEIHQYFVPGRYCSFADVLLDTCGGAAGMLLCICVVALYRRRQKRKAKNS